MNRIIVISLLMFVVVVLKGQVESNAGVIAIKQYELGEQALLDKKIKKAKRYFKKAIKNNPAFAAAHRGLGICYEQEKLIGEAINEYQEVLAIDSFFSRTLYYDLGELHYKAGQSKQAIDFFLKFEELQSVDIEQFGFNGDAEIKSEGKMRQKLPASLQACKISLDSAKFLNINEVIPLGAGINTSADEVFPFMANNQRLMFFNRRKNAFSDEDLYYSRIDDDGDWGDARAVKKINTNKNEGMCTFVRDERTMFFTVCGRKGVRGTCDIWQSDVKDVSVDNIRALEGYVNTDSWESEAMISCDGRTIYFVSNRAGGIGGTDIWYSKKEEDGVWSEPKNMGSKINTPMDEESPFITNDGKTLYFASTGHLGMGEQDIFVSWMDERTEQWSTPINLGLPVNSPFREVGFFLSADGKTGYFASDRTGGQGGMDIYYFELNETLYSDPITYVEGYVRDSITAKPLAVTIEMKGRGVIETQEDGRFFLCVKGDDYRDFKIEANGYHPFEQSYVIPEWDNKQFYSIELLLSPKEVIAVPIDTIKNKKETPKIVEEKNYFHVIHFGFDTHELTPLELNGLLDFLEQFKGKSITSIEIVGFADDIGDDTYNLHLSEERAKEIALLLVNNNLMADHIYMEGKGEVKDDRPKEQNRKVELRIFTLE